MSGVRVTQGRVVDTYPGKEEEFAVHFEGDPKPTLVNLRLRLEDALWLRVSS